MRKLVLMLVVSMLAMPATAGGYKYDAEDFKDIPKMADKLTDNDLSKLKKWNANKIVVSECTGEFLQSKEVTASAFAQSTAEMGAAQTAAATGAPLYTYTVNSKTYAITLGAEYYNSILNRVYDMVQQAFVDAGYQFVPKENLTAQEKYKTLDLDFQKTTKGYTGGMFKDSVSSKGLKVSAEGLGIYPTSPIKAMKLAGRIAELTGESGADTAMRINFYVDKGKKGAPVLRDFSITVNSDLRSDMRGFKGHESKVYEFYKQNNVIFKLNDALISQDDISGTEKNSVNMQKYDQALMTLIGSTIDMLKADLAKAKES